MDVFNGEDYFEKIFNFKETAAIGEKWAFFGMDNSNFVMNSGSYFVIQGGLVVYMIVFFSLNRVCSWNAKNLTARKIGMFVYEDNYWTGLINGSIKLFLESYFDLVICTSINVTAFVRSKNLLDFKEFFATRDDIICSTITITYSFMILFFPVYCYKYIQSYKGSFKKMDEIMEIIMEGVNPHNFNASMYTFYFLLRRLMTGVGLVVFVEYPFFQCASLLVFSTVNFIYIVNIRPLEDTKQNRIEKFNELTIMFCSHMYNIFLRGEGTIPFINGVGWTFMGAAVFNILGNLAVVVVESISDAGQKYVDWKFGKYKQQVRGDRKETREAIVQNAPGTVKTYEFELSLHEVLKKVKDWVPHRKWLVKNKVKFDDYPEEIEFQKLIVEYKLREKAEYGRISKSIARVA